MPKQPDLLIEQRRAEILETFLTLHETKSLGELNIKVVSEATRFTRATIYNYFKNIDEIFLSAYQQEYQAWAEDLQRILDGHDALTREDFADELARSLEKRERMLRFSLADFHEREANCRREFVFSHKVIFNQTIRLLHDCIAKFFPEKTEKEIIELLYMIFPFMHGKYRYVSITDVEREARQAANMMLEETSIYDLFYRFVLQILK